MNRQRALEENARKHSEFFRQLEGTTDGFSVVAKYFGRGLFNKPAHEAESLMPTLDPSQFPNLFPTDQ